MRSWTTTEFKASLKGALLAAAARAHWAALGLLLLVGAWSFWNTSVLIEANDSRKQVRTLLMELQNANVSLKEAEAGQRLYLLVGDESSLEAYRNATNVLDRRLDRASSLAEAVPGQRSNLDEVRRLTSLKLAEWKSTIQVRNGEGAEAALAIVRSGPSRDLTEQIRGIMEKIDLEGRQLTAALDRRIESLSLRVTLGGVLGILLAVVLLLSVVRGELSKRARRDLREQRTAARSGEKSRITSLSESDKEIEALGLQARELVELVESSRAQAVAHSEGEAEFPGQRPQNWADEIEVLSEQARELARSVESSRILTLHRSDEKIEALGQQARELATSVESSRIQTLKQSDKEIKALGQQARDLAAFVETTRIQARNQSNTKIEALERQALELAEFVETSRKQTLTLSDSKIEALGLQARELATAVETLRKQTLTQSDGKIEALGQQARDLATFVETSRIATLNQSNKEIRKLNEELEQRVLERTAQLEAANKELDAFSYSVSHDLRAPLRAIDGFSRIVLEDYAAVLPAEGVSYLQLVRDNTRQMGQLVDDLLAFARLGRQSLAKHSVDSNKLVRRCLEEMTKEQEGRKVEFAIGELPVCDADSALLKQVWTNLLSNSLKYTRKREVACIEVGCRTQSRPAAGGSASPDVETVFFVKDNGAGFDMKYARKLFGVFQRLHKAADYEGTGVGLAIVQRIVQRHGGRIWAEASLNQGATFSFTLR